MVYQWLKYNLSRIFPAQCLVCGETCTGMALCQDCEQELTLNRHACQRCAEPLSEGYHNSLCGRCLKQTPSFDKVLSPYLYQAPIDRLVTRFKFNADHTAGQVLVRLLGQYLQQHVPDKPECLVPVPLHPSRLRERGFNQAHEFWRVKPAT
ncbi:MAG: double zinc ribbon domain-containing protein [Gammaproteobacteria bacterium]